MIAFAEYLLKVILCSALLTGYYWFALRNKLFHAWNRFYLLASVVIAIGLPFLKITFSQEQQQLAQPAYQVLQTITTNEVWFEATDTTATAKQTFFTAENLSIGLYLLVSFITLIILLIAIIRIILLIKKYQHWKINNLVFVDTDAIGTPFSFLHFIFWNREIDFNSQQGQQIFAHELVHVKQKHSWDKLFINTVFVVFWSNPFFWLIRKELTMIHEFIADQQSVKDHDTASFAAMILVTTFPGYTMPLTNPFFYSPIKRRLLMLTKLQNPKIGYISRLLLLPLLIFLVVSFAVKTKEKTSPLVSSKLNRQITVVIDAGHGLRKGIPQGAKGLNGITEDEISLAIAKKIAELNKDENLKLIFTRPDENFVELNERIKIAEENKADLLISIHESYATKIKKGNGYVDNPANGFEIYIAKEGTTHLSESRELGSAILNEMKNIMAIKEPGMKQRETGIYIIGAAPCPAVLIECGYISNPKDAAFVTDEKNQEKIAEAVLKAIVNYATANEKKSRIAFDTTTSFSNAEIYDQNRNVLIQSDTIILKDSGTIKGTYKPIYIVNGKRINSDTVKNIVITSGKITTYPANSKEAIAKYGADAKNGVVVFENAVLKDKPKNKDTIPVPQTVFTKAEIMPLFPGGEKAWNNHIQECIEKNIDALIKEGREGTCEVEFIVDKEGNINNLKINTLGNTKLAEIFAEAILKGPKWIPAIQNGKKVDCWKKEKLTFRLPGAVAKPKDANNGKQTEETEYWVSMAVKNSNTIYLGINNPIVIATSSSLNNDIIVTSNNGSITKENNQWIAKPAFLGEAILTVSSVLNKTTTELQKYTLKVKNLPNPVITIGGSKGGRMSAQKFMQVKQIDIEEGWEITGYVIYLTGAGFPNPMYKQVMGSCQFDKDVLELVSKCGPGTTITIDELRAKLKNSDIKARVPGIFLNLF